MGPSHPYARCILNASAPSLSNSRRPDGREVVVDAETGALEFYRYEQASGYGCAGF